MIRFEVPALSLSIFLSIMIPSQIYLSFSQFNSHNFRNSINNSLYFLLQPYLLIFTATLFPYEAISLLLASMMVICLMFRSYELNWG